jgi:cyclic dehypoxanthinyl futalosine synthase
LNSGTRFAQNLIEKSDISDIVNNVVGGSHLKLSDYVRLLESDDVHSLGISANYLRTKLFGKDASFVNNIILNYTNVCVTYCKFCAFYRPPGHSESYTLSLRQILDRVIAAKNAYGITQILIQGGHNPNLKIEYYEEAFREIKRRYPEIGIHGLSASEIDMIARVERSSTREILHRLKLAGLDSLPGAGAEILDDDVKSIISPLKIKTDEWLRIMEEAHSLGIRSSATMMYGTVETTEQRAKHLLLIAKLQEKTRGFMSFIPWSFEPNKTEMQSDGSVRYPSGGLGLLKMVAISRIVFYGLIDHLQSSWLTNGIGMAQLALNYGADDFGGTLIGEEVVSATGARSTEMTANKIIESIRQIGYRPCERDNYYNKIRYF